MTTHKDQEIDRAVRKYTQDLINSRMGGMPQCRIVANVGHRMSPNKILWDILNDDAIKKHIQSLNEQILKQAQASPKLC